MRIPLVGLKAQYATIQREVDAAIRRVVDNQSFILGKEVSDFENAFAQFIGATDAVGVASGTAALQLALEALGVGPGDEVIAPSHTFIATAEAISHTGAVPVFVDVDPDTYLIDPARVEAAITPRTRALIPVHLYGQPAPMAALLEIARRHRLAIVEDAAQAHGAEDQGGRCGILGDLGCFSFFPGKNLGAYGDAGAVTGKDPELLTKVRKLRNHGRLGKYEHELIGFGERIDALQAAVLGAKLPHLEAWTEARRSHARRYNELLSGCDVVIPEERPGVRHVYHLYVIRVKGRDEVLARLESKGVEAGVHYPIPLHRQPAYRGLVPAGLSLPVTERLVGEIVSLPMYPELTDEQISYVAEAVKEAVRS